MATKDNESDQDDLDNIFKMFKRRGKQNKDDETVENVVRVDLEKDKSYYNMNHKNRGFAIIFNNEEFWTYNKNTIVDRRDGSLMDKTAILKILTLLGFSKDHILSRDNFSREGILNEIDKLSKEDHSDNDCLLVFVLSHGKTGGRIQASDSMFYTVEDLWKPFQGNNCSSLTGKPKLFFIQACRGEKFDRGSLVSTDCVSTVYRIPSEADFLIACSTTEDHFAWRNKMDGSWFIQTLCWVLKEDYEDSSLLSMMTKVNRIVATNRISKSNKPDYNGKVEVPCFYSTLTRKIYFKKEKTVHQPTSS